MARRVFKLKKEIRLSEKQRIDRKPRYLESSTLNGYSIQSKEIFFFLIYQVFGKFRQPIIRPKTVFFGIFFHTISEILQSMFL